MPYRDFEEFIASLNAHGVRYLVIGAHAVAHHGRPRATKDLDVLVDPTRANARRVLAAVRDFFGGAELGYSIEDVADDTTIIQLGVAPVRIDLLSRIPGCASFRAAWKSRVDAKFGSESAHFLGYEDLIRSKTATGRPQDLADVDSLRRLKRAGTRNKPRP